LKSCGGNLSFSTKASCRFDFSPLLTWTGVQQILSTGPVILQVILEDRFNVIKRLRFAHLSSHFKARFSANGEVAIPALTSIIPHMTFRTESLYNQILSVRKFTHPNVIHLPHVFSSRNSSKRRLAYNNFGFNLRLLLPVISIAVRHLKKERICCLAAQICSGLLSFQETKICLGSLNPDDVLINCQNRIVIWRVWLSFEIGAPIRFDHQLGHPSRLAPDAIIQAKFVGPCCVLWSCRYAISELIIGRELFGSGSSPSSGLDQIGTLSGCPQ
jgi:serine/threonine protein kinase